MREQMDRAVELPLPKGGSILMDTKNKKVINNPEETEYRRQLFIRQILRHHHDGLIDLSELAPLEIVDRNSVEGALGLIATQLVNSELIRTRHSGKALRVDLSTRGPSHTVWLRDENVA